MTTTRAAKYLNGTDTGKTITSPTRITGIIATVEHNVAYTRVRLDPPADDGTHALLLKHNSEVTVTGQPSPHSDDPHGINTRKSQ